jgi:uncharacterized protein (TIGR00369 family)
LTSEPLLTPPDVRIGGDRIVLAPHNCFACGTLNTHGLHLELHAGGDRCWTEITLDRRFEGWDGIAHGGIVCTLLDEVMAWALVEHDHWGVTARMNVDFKRPVPVGRLVRAEGRVVGLRRRLVDATGMLIDPATGEVLARSEATYVAAPEARKEELKSRYAFRVVPDEVATADGSPAGTPELVDAG